MNTSLNHLTPFIDKEPEENIDLFVCEECDDHRKYGIFRYLKKGKIYPCDDDNTPKKRLMRALYGVEVPETGFYHCNRKKTDEGYEEIWVRSSINPLDASYIVINPEDMD